MRPRVCEEISYRIAHKPVPRSCLVYASLLARHERIELFPTALAF